RLDAEEPGESPQDDRRQREQREAAAAEIAGHESAQPVLAAPQKFFEIGGRAPRAPPPPAPRGAVPRPELSPPPPTLPRPCGAALVAGNYVFAASKGRTTWQRAS